MKRVRRVLTEDLTEKQSQAIIALTIHGVPLEELARQMNMEKNALYKLVHDARLRMKKRLAEEDLSPADILAAFE